MNQLLQLCTARTDWFPSGQIGSHKGEVPESYEVCRLTCTNVRQRETELQGTDQLLDVSSKPKNVGLIIDRHPKLAYRPTSTNDVIVSLI